MNKTKRLTAVLSGLLIGMGLRSLAKTLKDKAPSREKAITITLLICLFLVAITALLRALNLI